MAGILNTDDIIDVRDVIARVEELTNEQDDLVAAHEEAKTRFKRAKAKELREWREDNGEELRILQALLDDLKGYGGDEQWRGDWYPITLIRDSYFQDYAEELAEDCGMINRDATWPNNCIDWERAARELQIDYSSVEFDGVTYWYR